METVFLIAAAGVFIFLAYKLAKNLKKKPSDKAPGGPVTGPELPSEEEKKEK